MYSFPNLEPVYSMSSSTCCFLTCIQISQEVSQVVWYSSLLKNIPQFVVIHTVKGFGLVNKADVFLELSCFLDNPTDVGNLISGSSAFSKSSLNIWKFMVHILLKPGLENFEHYFASMWDECNRAIVCFLWRCLSLGLEWNRSSLSPSFCSLKCPDTTPNRVGRTPTYAPGRLCLCGEVAFPTTVWGFISSMAKKEVKTSLPSGSQHFIIFILTL